MIELVITFHTHFGAMKLYKGLKKQGEQVRMVPVPRALSSDCGSCVRLSCPEMPDATGLLTEDAEAVYLDGDSGFEILASGE